jgi:ABC-type uncharacterized transport system substrate-binding protein
MLATQLVPGAARIGMLLNLSSAESIDQRRDMNDAAQKLPLTIVPAEVRKWSCSRLTGHRAIVIELA